MPEIEFYVIFAAVGTFFANGFGKQILPPLSQFVTLNSATVIRALGELPATSVPKQSAPLYLQTSDRVLLISPSERNERRTYFAFRSKYVVIHNLSDDDEEEE